MFFRSVTYCWLFYNGFPYRANAISATVIAFQLLNMPNLVHLPEWIFVQSLFNAKETDL
jgi:aryl-phospho-beta-D-glucosidase BglC (GH1 family)